MWPRATGRKEKMEHTLAPPETASELLVQLRDQFLGTNPPKDFFRALQAEDYGVATDEATEMLMDAAPPEWFEDATPTEIANLITDLLETF